MFDLLLLLLLLSLSLSHSHSHSHSHSVTVHQQVNIEDPNGGQKPDQQGGPLRIRKLWEEKKKHLLSVHVMEKLLKPYYSSFPYEYGEGPNLSSGDHAGGDGDTSNRNEILAYGHENIAGDGGSTLRDNADKKIAETDHGEPLRIRKLWEEKKKHLLSVNVKEKLLELYYSSFSYEYGEGSNLSSGEHARGDGETSKRNEILAYGHENIAGDGGSTLVDNADKKTSETDHGKKDEDNEKKKVIIVKKIFGVTIKVDDDDEKKKKKLEYMTYLKNESPLLTAAKHGTLEMVKGILKVAPMAIHDENIDGKNVVLLAAENRQPDVYNFLRKRQDCFKQSLFYKTDKHGNSALHLTAKMEDTQSWNISGPALQMQWETKWYQFVEKSMPPNFFVRYNKNMETAWEIFCESHSDLVIEAGKWLTTTSQACSVVSVLIATVAFTTCTTVPGGPNQTGAPVMEKEAPFQVFAIGSLVALCFSIASVVMFMVFFTSRYKMRDFATNLPLKFLVELTCLLISIAAVLISFCSAHFLVIRDSYKFTAFSLYAATLFPVGLYACWQIPRYVELMVATFRRKPHRIYE